MKEIDDKLNKLIEFEEIYSDPSISYATIAVKVYIPQYQLSQFLNDYQKTSFASFINKYRIQKAEELLLNKLDRTILGIAIDVDFSQNRHSILPLLNLKIFLPMGIGKNVYKVIK